MYLSDSLIINKDDCFALCNEDYVSIATALENSASSQVSMRTIQIFGARFGQQREQLHAARFLMGWRDVNRQPSIENLRLHWRVGYTPQLPVDCGALNAASADSFRMQARVGKRGSAKRSVSVPASGRWLVLGLSFVAIAVLWGIVPAYGQAKQPQWKDRAEFDLYDAITKDSNAATRLEKIDTWKKQYAATEFEDARKQLYIATYQQLNRPADVFVVSKDALASDPNNLRALTALVYGVYQLPAPTKADDLDAAEKAANQILSSLETLFAADKKPAGGGDEDWNKNKKQIQFQARMTVGWVAMIRKDYENAEVEFKKALAIDPYAGQVDYWLGTAMVAQKKPEKQSDALFYFARAASYEGTGALNLQGRGEVRKYLSDKAYAPYHGSKEGLDDLLTYSMSHTEPGSYHIATAKEIAEKNQAQEQELAKQNPGRALWNSIQAALKAADGQTYFEANMKGRLLPGGANGVTEFKGKIISMAPPLKPREVTIAIGDDVTADAVLKLDAALPGTMEPGASIGFQGEAVAFTKDPFLVSFQVEKAKISGWTGKNTSAVPARVHRK